MGIYETRRPTSSPERVGMPASAAAVGPLGARPLRQDVRTAAEEVLGHDFSRVSVYPGSALSRSLGAVGVTRDGGVHLASSREDVETTAHELAHLVQQSQGKVSPDRFVAGEAVAGSADLEAEADRAARRVMSRMGASEPTAALGPNSAPSGAASGGLRRLVIPTVPVVQCRVRQGRTAAGEKPDKFYSTVVSGEFGTYEEAQRAEDEAMAVREEAARQAAETRARLRQEREARDVTPGANAKWGLDKATEAAHNAPRDDRYQGHSVTATAIPVRHADDEGTAPFGPMVISQQRRNKNTEERLAAFARRTGVGSKDVPTKVQKGNLASGQHADMYAVFDAFAGDYDETDELPPVVLFGSSKGRCDPCDDALRDLPVAADPDRVLGGSTSQWEHPERTDAESMVDEEDDDLDAMKE